jgi:hypothetical protein
MEAVAKVFEKYSLQVYTPEVIKDCNQVFARDIHIQD